MQALFVLRLSTGSENRTVGSHVDVSTLHVRWQGDYRENANQASRESPMPTGVEAGTIRHLNDGRTMAVIPLLVLITRLNDDMFRVETGSVVA